MPFMDLREWLGRLDKEGELRRVTAEVDWNREIGAIARRVLEACRQDAEGCVGNDIPIAVSIGVAQWTREFGAFPDRLIAAADHALYAAKKEGKNRYAAYDPVPSRASEADAASASALRKRA